MTNLQPFSNTAAPSNDQQAWAMAIIKECLFLRAENESLTKGPMGEMLQSIRKEAMQGSESYPDASGLMMALMEEVGELARAMMSEPRENIRAEAVQVAALAIRIAIEGDPTLDAIRAKNNADFPLPPILLYGP